MPLTSSVPDPVQLLKLPLPADTRAVPDFSALPDTHAPAPSHKPARDNECCHRRAPPDQIARGYLRCTWPSATDQQAVVAFLMALARAAVQSSWRRNLFHVNSLSSDPATRMVTGWTSNPGDQLQSSLDTTDIAKASMSDSSSSSTVLKGLKDRSSPAFKLLRWMACSNAPHVVKLPPSRRVSILGTPHQFLLVGNSHPAKEARFQKAKAASGGRSVFAFHGSRLENWHSILRQGLLVASQTALQANGNHYGNGIYLSPYPRVAWLYSSCNSPSENVGKEQRNKGSTGPVGGDDLLEAKTLSCLALCEVVDSGSLSRRCDTQWVCRNSDHVSVRLLLVYESSAVLDGPPVSFPVDHFLKNVESAMAFGRELRLHC